jgi:coenzyme F420-0:L-glutamate ligase/coenzyme F420-1:gamma-L-glutamate ligase
VGAAGGDRVVLTGVPGVPLVEPGDDLARLLVEALRRAAIGMEDGDILVVAQKVVSKSEGRYVDLASVVPSPRALELAAAVGKDPRFVEVVLSESSEVVRYRRDVLIVAHRRGYVMANAGIDQSNIAHPDGRERVLLLPRDPDGAARDLKAALDGAFNADVGVVINDSFGRPWRNGVASVALGAAGIPSLVSEIGKPDLFGRAMRMTEIAFADEVASAAALVMGETDDAIPAVHVRGLRPDAPQRPAADLLRPRERDLFR